MLIVLVAAVIGFLLIAGLLLRGRSRRVADALTDGARADVLRREVAGALARTVAPGLYRPGGITMRGKAAKHFRLACGTLIVDAPPASVVDIVAAPIEAAGAKFRRVHNLAHDEVAAWEAESIFGPFPRLTLRPSPDRPGATEIGASRIRVSLRFPQGGVFVKRATAAAASALTGAGLVYEGGVRRFEPGPDTVADGDGVWLRTADCLP